MKTPKWLWLIVAAAGYLFCAAGENTKTNLPLYAAKQTHWSLKPVTRPKVPAVANSKWKARNPLDNFIFARLAESRLSPSPEADRRTLIRRLSFDLIGLPPTPEEVAAFEKDRGPDAYERLVERLLASPQYGERWARHWLDVVRFAETHGFEMNQPRPNAWLYRDYVVRAFNADKPYDRFILEQFAGDLLDEDAATGFLVGGAWDQVKSPDMVLTATQRADELHDMVSTTGSAFLGLTIGCARCHDHKFDPIPQTNYYAIKACLAGVQHGERSLPLPDRAAREREAEQCRMQLLELEARLAEFEPLACTETTIPTNSLRPPVNPRRNVERFKPVSARFLRFTVSRTTDAEPCLDELEVYSAGPAPKNIARASTGVRARASGVFPNSDIHRLEHLNDGKVGNSHSWISDERGQGWVELEFRETVTIDRVVWGRDREEKFSDRLALDYRVEAGLATNDLRLAASSADRQPYVAGKSSGADILLTSLPPESAQSVKALLSARTNLLARIKELTTGPMVYAGTFTARPEPTRRLNRGDPMQEREIVEPGGLSVIPIAFHLTEPELPPKSGATNEPTITPDQQRRLTLARWIADPANPLPARVMVNRLWQYHFGEGLVGTPSDFGANGAKPTHPELLDWLAAEFVTPTWAATNAIPWSIKHLHRLIVTSSTYRQASAPRADCVAADASSRLLWRFPARRLEAEPLRDAILAVTGKLDLRPGGPGFSPFEPNDNYVRVYQPKKEFGPDEWRRMVYMTKVRMQQDSTFGAFDCPDGGQIAPKRMRSTTPLQALNLMNSEFMLQQAGLFAARLEREAGASPKSQIQRAFALAFNRPPSKDESSAAEKFIAQQGLALFCRALFNSNEFVFID